MTEWKEVEKSAGGHGGGGRAPSIDRVSVYHAGATGACKFNRVYLSFSSNLVTADRADVLTDGNGRLAVRFSANGRLKVNKRQSRGRMSVVSLRKAAAQLFPRHVSGSIPWTREGDLIVIDTRKFNG